MRTVYVCIGNSDNKLTQVEWYNFYVEMDSLIQCYAEMVFGVWFSKPDSPYQNMCWSFSISDADAEKARKNIVPIRTRYRQDSVAWAETKETEFI